MLAKAVKKKAKSKAESQKEWKERSKQEKGAISKRQGVREQNIAGRKTKKKSKNEKKRAGFEGASFLN